MRCIFILGKLTSDVNNSWHLDKRVPVAMILALSFQLVGAVWFFASLTSRVDANTINITRAEIAFANRMDRHESQAADRYRAITDALIRIENKLDKKVDK